jgi:hypothetical protein
VRGIAKGQVCQIPSGKPEGSNDHSALAALTIIILFSKNVRIFTQKDFKEQKCCEEFF